MTDIGVHKIAGHIGAEVTGIQAGPSLPPDHVRAVRNALLEHRVIFLRGQHQLDDAGQAGFAELFGDLTAAHPIVSGLDSDERIREVDAQRPGGKASFWHTDVTFIDRPPAITVLRAVTLPPYGGDTTWANTVAAYETLPPEFRAIADTLWAVHTTAFGNDKQPGSQPALDHAPHKMAAPFPLYETEHPVVRVHPETRERALLLGGFAKRILGVSASASGQLCARLQRHVTRLENTVRWRWAPGDLAVWDNRTTQHYAIDDYGDLPRVMRRVTISGDLALATDGRTSRAVAGDASRYVRA
jgi:alpha-ketoglutarate-dependent sulfate ester dioxygenase